MPEEKLREKDVSKKSPLVRYLTAGFLAAGLYAGCGGEDKEEECNTNRDCLDNCIDYVIEADCNYSNPSPGQVERCRELGIQRCQDQYSSGALRCGRYCGERTIPDCHDPDDSYCGQERTEAYCENSCSPNQ